MPVEISQSGGLTFRVTDTSGKVKFDINKKQPKVVQTFHEIGSYPDADANYIIVRTGTGGTHSNFQYNTTAVVQSVSFINSYTNISPTNGFILAFIYFPDSGTYDNTNLVYFNTGNANYNARGNREAMFLMPLGKWIPANGGKIIRHYFTQNNIGYRGWSGTQIFFYNWTDNPLYNPSSISYPLNYKYRIIHGISTQCNSLVGARERTGGNYLYPNGLPPAIFNMSGGINTVGVGTAKMKSTRVNMHTRLFLCK